jgi:colanic acid/amylovoran biosynthesis glycosyltransferase
MDTASKYGTEMKICITRSRKSGYTETFIRNQITGLLGKTNVVTLHSGRLPQRTEDGKLVGPWIYWLVNQIIKGLTGNRNNYFSHYGLKRFLISEKIDLVVGNYGLSAAHFVPICKDLNIPLVVIFHGYDATLKKVVMRYQAPYQKLFSYASAIVAVSVEMKHKLITLGAPAEKIAVIPYGIDIRKFSPAEDKKIAPLLVAVGRFTFKKAPLLTINAFHRVWLKHPEARLVMIGDKSGLYQNCVEVVKALKLEKAVSFTGKLSPEEISGWMKQANVFVQHSITAPNGDMEGTPNSVLEAAASGLPVVSTFHGGIKEAVVNNQTGYLVPEKDVVGMAEYINKLIENPETAKSMGEKARQHVLENYSLDKQIDKLYNLIRDSVIQFRKGLPRRVLILENKYHQEIIPPQARILLNAGYEVHLFIAEKLWDRDLFGDIADKIHVTLLKKNSNFLNKLSIAVRVRKYIRKEGINFLVFNTLDSNFNYFLLRMNQGIRSIGIIHQAHRIFRKKIHRKNLSLVDGIATLSRFTLDYFRSNDSFDKDAVCFYPIFFNGQKETVKASHEGIQVAIPGQFDLNKRDYFQLLDTLREVNPATAVKFYLLGNVKNGDGPEIIAYIKRHKLEHFFEWEEKFIPYKKFFQVLRESDYVMPLLSSRVKNSRNYRESQISASFNWAYSFQKMLILHSEFSGIVEDKDDTVFYDDYNFKDVLESLKKPSENLYHPEILSYAVQEKAYLSLFQSIL